jgi:hypothetical protein
VLIEFEAFKGFKDGYRGHICSVCHLSAVIDCSLLVTGGETEWPDPRSLACSNTLLYVLFEELFNSHGGMMHSVHIRAGEQVTYRMMCELIDLLHEIFPTYKYPNLNSCLSSKTSTLRKHHQ